MENKGDQIEETKKKLENDPWKTSLDSETVSISKIDPKDGFVSPPTKELEDKLEEVSIGSESQTQRNSDTPKSPKSVTSSADLTREPHSPSVSEPSAAARFLVSLIRTLLLLSLLRRLQLHLLSIR